jgi:hypothetical protein
MTTLRNRRTWHNEPRGMTSGTGAESLYRQDRPPIGIWLALGIWVAIPTVWVLGAWWIVSLISE